jgi:hypothetical protein
VDVLDAFEAKRERAAKPVFEVAQWAIGGGYYVRATLDQRRIFSPAIQQITERQGRQLRRPKEPS